MAPFRQLAAIMFTDIVGYTALMGEDEDKAFEILRKNRQLQKPVIEKYNGKWIKEIGDGVLASFTAVSDAVLCASEIQNVCNGKNEFKLRIGIHLGEIMFDNEDIFGDGVNIASRLQTIAPVGGIWVSESVQKNVSNKKEILTRFIREEVLKNVKDPVRIYEVMTDHHSFEKENKDSPGKFPGKSVAVLPFVNMSSDPEQEYFSDGISEEIINILAQIPSLKVPGRTSTFTFKGKNEDLRSIGQKLSVNTILEGSVRSAGNRIRITAQLINVQDGFQIWSEKYERILTDVFEVQDEIAATIVKKLQITLDGHLAAPRSREHTDNIEAYKYYLKGRALAYKRGRFILEAKTIFEKAIEIDPEYALAYAGLADTYTMICYFGLSDPDLVWPKAIDNARLAMKYGPQLAETQTCNADIALLYEWDYDKARKFFLKALELNPGYEQARTWYGHQYLQCVCSKHPEAISNCRLALATHPLSSYSQTILGLTLGFAGELEECQVLLKQAAAMDPESYLTLISLAGSYAVTRDFELAIETYEIALQLSGRHSWALAFLSVVYTLSDKREEALEIFEELRSKTGYVQPTLLAIASAALGNTEEAIRFAQTGLDKRDPFLILGEGNPFCAPLKAIPAFGEMRKKMHLT
jgi:TolB-like protein/Tfp pilus assembly protein PilF